MTVTTCQGCNAILEELPQTPPEMRHPCPTCGSTARLYKVLIVGAIECKSSLGLKARHSGVAKPFLEQKSGDSFFKRAQKWVYRVMRIDRDNDHYSEIVVDKTTNEIIHKCEEPLSKHQGHGSAKKNT